MLASGQKIPTAQKFFSPQPILQGKLLLMDSFVSFCGKFFLYTLQPNLLSLPSSYSMCVCVVCVCVFLKIFLSQSAQMSHLFSQLIVFHCMEEWYFMSNQSNDGLQNFFPTFCHEQFYGNDCFTYILVYFYRHISRISSYRQNYLQNG